MKYGLRDQVALGQVEGEAVLNPAMVGPSFDIEFGRIFSWGHSSV